MAGRLRPPCVRLPTRKGACLVLPSVFSLLTDAGDSGLLLPLTLVSAAALWYLHSRRLAWLLLRSVLMAGVAIVVCKVVFLSCASHWQTAIHSPSGHACMSAVVYGSLGVVLCAGRTPLARVVITTAVIFVVGAIAISRVLLGVHTIAEVCIGLVIGILAQLLFAHSTARMEPVRFEARTFTLALAATWLITIGVRLPAESILRHLARRVVDICAAETVPRQGKAPDVWRARDLRPYSPLRNTAATSWARSPADWS